MNRGEESKSNMKTQSNNNNVSSEVRFVEFGSVIDDSGSNTVAGRNMTADEEREYNAGMARLAEMFG